MIVATENKGESEGERCGASAFKVCSSASSCFFLISTVLRLWQTVIKKVKLQMQDAKLQFGAVFGSCVTSSSSAFHHSAYLTSGHSLLLPSLHQPVAGVGSALGRITEGHGSPTCFDTTPKEGVIYICSVGLLFSSNHGEKKKQKTFLPALVCSPPLSHLSSLCSLSSAGLILQIIPGGGRGIISVER